MAKFRILYAGGPANVIGTYLSWVRGEDEPNLPDVAYSRQFFDVCHEIGAEAWVIAAQPNVKVVDEESFRIEHRVIPFDGRSGLIFHIGRLIYTLGLIRSALKYHADVAIVAQHGVHWFLLSVLPAFGVKVIPAIHNTLWLDLAPPNLVGRMLLRMARPLFSRQSVAILSHPGTCVRQVRDLVEGAPCAIEPFIPFYRRTTFAGLPDRGLPRPPFRVLFAGRIETEKGVFDLLEVARQLAQQGRTDIEFDVCGTGSVLPRLRSAVAEAQLESQVRCHGRLEMKEFREMFGRCHVVLVPTRSSYSEGFNAVVAEAILSGRPVITSKLCPAIELVRDAVVEVEPEDVTAYRDAILRLCDDEAFYESKRRPCADLKLQFFDWSRSWGAGLQRILAKVSPALALPVDLRDPSASAGG